MLQNLNIDGNDRQATIEEGEKNNSRNKSQNNKLQRVNSVKHQNKIEENVMELSMEHVKMENTIQEVYVDPNKPKV